MALQAKNKKNTEPRAVVVVGASTGGLEAIEAFLDAFPAEAGVALIVVQHQMSDHESLSAKLFRAHTRMPVQQAESGQALQANQVYTAPPNQYLAVRQGCLILTPEPTKKSLDHPIDHCLQSFAEQYAERLIAVVLSGNGNDGSQGVKAVSAHNGLVLVQELESARADAMPRSALATGYVDDSLLVSAMPTSILHYVNILDNASAAMAGALALLRQQCGYDFSAFKKKTLMRRIGRRMGLHGLTHSSEYLALLKKDKQEVNALFADLLIGVTAFFRDPDAWKELELNVIKPLIATKKKDDVLRIWVPACSSGEEAYSVAMLLLERLRRSRKQCALQIFATDANPQALKLARAGQYPAHIAKQIPASYLKRYFTLSADGQHYQANELLRSQVVFGQQNLLSDPPFGRLDLISCRNVLIYLNPDVQKNVIATFHFALRSPGYLFLGNAESHSGRDDCFQALSSQYRIYRRLGATRFQPAKLSTMKSETRTAPLLPQVTENPAVQAAQIAAKLIMERFAPAVVLLNSALEVLYFGGPVDDFLQRPRGAPTQDLLTMVREGLRSQLHAGLLQAQKINASVEIAGVLMRQAAEYRKVDIVIAPVHASLGLCFMVVFRYSVQPSVGFDHSQSPTEWVQYLEQELLATRNDLATTTERFEDVNERLRVSAEVVLASNENLRTLNEELESAKEELQSYNAEITTVNQQLESKLRELETTHNDLQNVLNSSDMAIVGLDRELRVKWFSPAAQRLLRIEQSDYGRSLSQLHWALTDPQLLDEAQQLLKGQSVRDVDICADNGKRWMRRLLPYMNKQQMDGVILSYTDITESYQSTQAVLRAQRDLETSQERAERLRVLSAAMANAEERERRALAKDLHDDLGQLLAVIGLKISMLQKQNMTETLHDGVQDCAKAVQIASQKMREITLQLNPPMLDQLGFIPAMHWLADEMHRMHQLEVVIHDDGLPQPMLPAVSSTLFRTLRELLHKIAQHAQVKEVEITTERGLHNTFIVTVEDVGDEFDLARIEAVQQGHISDLLSVRERLGYLGGEMSLLKDASGGTAVVLKVPLLSPFEITDAKEQSQT